MNKIINIKLVSHIISQISKIAHFHIKLLCYHISELSTITGYQIFPELSIVTADGTNEFL